MKAVPVYITQHRSMELLFVLDDSRYKKHKRTQTNPLDSSSILSILFSIFLFGRLIFVNFSTSLAFHSSPSVLGQSDASVGEKKKREKRVARWRFQGLRLFVTVKNASLCAYFNCDGIPGHGTEYCYGQQRDFSSMRKDLVYLHRIMGDLECIPTDVTRIFSMYSDLFRGEFRFCSIEVFVIPVRKADFSGGSSSDNP